MIANARSRQHQLRRRIQFLTWLLIAGLLFSGVTAIPLQWELDQITRILKSSEASAGSGGSGLQPWLIVVRDGLGETYAKYPFVAYGTDWLAFAHIVIAIAFIGAVQHPLRNGWLFTWGMMASVLIIPWALLFGELRSIPLGWRLIDGAFGVLGFFPCWFCARWTRELDRLKRAELETEERLSPV